MKCCQDFLDAQPGQRLDVAADSQGAEDGQEIRDIEVDPQRGPHITWLFQEYATGNWTVKELQKDLTNRGLTTRPGPRRPEGPVSIKTIHDILKNPW